MHVVNLQANLGLKTEGRGGHAFFRRILGSGTHGAYYLQALEYIIVGHFLRNATPPTVLKIVKEAKKASEIGMELATLIADVHYLLVVHPRPFHLVRPHNHE